MNSTAEKDEAFGDGYMNISKTKKRLIRVTMKSYENTGTYVFLKVFKCGSTADKEFKLHQQISLNMEEFNKLICVADKVRYFEKKTKGICRQKAPLMNTRALVQLSKTLTTNKK